MSVVHNGDFDESGVTLEEAREIEKRSKQSSSDDPSEQEEEQDEKETQEEEERTSDEETEDDETESDEDDSDEDDSEDEDEDNDSDEGDESDEDDSADDTSKAEKGLSRREERLEKKLSEKRERLKLLRKLNKRADKKIDSYSDSGRTEEEESDEDDEEDFLSQYDEKQISRYMRKQGYVRKDELDRSNLKDTVRTEQEEFFDKHPEYLQEEELAEDLLEYADVYKDPRGKGDWARNLRRAHADRLRDLKIEAKHTPDSTRRAKKAAMAVETGGGGSPRSSKNKAKQSEKHKPRTAQQRQVLLSQGWSEEDLA